MVLCSSLEQAQGSVAGNSCSLLDGRIDVLQHVLVKVFVPVDSLQILLELLSTRTKAVKV